MLKIAICDDDTGDRERIAEDLRVYAAAHQEHGIETTVYSSAFAMLDAFEKAGMKPVGINPDSNLVEAVELEGHPWFIGVQYHPEYKSTVSRPHPLFRAFVAAAVAYEARQA